MTPRERLAAEDELSWLFTVAPTLLSPAGAWEVMHGLWLIGGSPHRNTDSIAGPTDDCLVSAARAGRITRHLREIPKRHCRIIELRYDATQWSPADHRDFHQLWSDYDYLVGIVRFFCKSGSPVLRRLKARTLLTRSLESYCRVRFRVKAKNVLHCA